MLEKVWSSGIALYAMLCGRLPFKASWLDCDCLILVVVSWFFGPGEEHVRAEAMHPTWKDSQLVGFHHRFLAFSSYTCSVCVLPRSCKVTIPTRLNSCKILSWYFPCVLGSLGCLLGLYAFLCLLYPISWCWLPAMRYPCPEHLSTEAQQLIASMLTLEPRTVKTDGFLNLFRLYATTSPAGVGPLWRVCLLTPSCRKGGLHTWEAKQFHDVSGSQRSHLFLHCWKCQGLHSRAREIYGHLLCPKPLEDCGNWVSLFPFTDVSPLL